MGLAGQRHASTALLPGKSPKYEFYRRLGGPQDRFGRLWRTEHLLSPSTAGVRIPDVQPVALCCNERDAPTPSE